MLPCRRVVRQLAAATEMEGKRRKVRCEYLPTAMTLLGLLLLESLAPALGLSDPHSLCHDRHDSYLPPPTQPSRD